MKFLFDIDIIDYVFINEKIARFICQKLKIVFIRFLYFLHIRCFNEKNIKSIIYVIYLTLTMQNHKKITIFLFIIKINKHFLILELLWFNKHQSLLNDKNNSLQFKLEKCNHENSSFKKIVKIARDSLKQTNLYVFSSNKFATISSISKFSKYRIFFKQKKFVQNFFAFVKRSSKTIVKNVFDKNNNSRKKNLNVDSFWNLIEINEKKI